MFLSTGIKNHNPSSPPSDCSARTGNNVCSNLRLSIGQQGATPLREKWDFAFLVNAFMMTLCSQSLHLHLNARIQLKPGRIILLLISYCNVSVQKH